MINADIILIVLTMGFSLGLYALAGYAAKVLSSKWKLCYILPFVVCIVFMEFSGLELSLLGVYIGCVLLLMGFMKESVRVRRIVSICTALLAMITIPVCLLNTGYRMPNFAAEFKSGFESMREHYCMAEHKEIDWDALYDEYLPKFKEVQKNHDAVENYILWTKLCNSMHDGHVAYYADNEIMDAAVEKMYGNDYGLSLITLSDGNTVAVNVEEGSTVYAAGIRNGTIITAWDGKAVDELKTSDTPIVWLAYNPVKENDDFNSALLVAGMGGDTVSIRFLDENGEERSVNAAKLGAYADRLKNTTDLLYSGIVASNMTWHDLNDDTAVLRLTQMMYDTNAAETGDYVRMKDELKAGILEQKEKGIQNLIIDLRSNSGGDPNFILAAAELFSPEQEFTYAYSGVWDEEQKCFAYDAETERYVVGNKITYTGENVWGDGRIVLLVNMETISAGDHFTKLMSVLDNVTIMGFTGSNCSGQGIRGVQFEDGALQFSSVPTLNADGTIYVDTDISRQVTVPLGVQIPFDENAVKAIFDDGEDYELGYAEEYLRK
ncbi:MAG: S41 family peptidase [Clostridium sp.]|nr:S41 family peptidase [Clostridium sp.]MCM1399443.1 S41 family peptidase [Clostridium sp.]MCM1459997.1 S41 family peptidase [Bacteroides sp.]